MFLFAQQFYRKIIKKHKTKTSRTHLLNRTLRQTSTLHFVSSIILINFLENIIYDCILVLFFGVCQRQGFLDFFIN